MQSKFYVWAQVVRILEEQLGSAQVSTWVGEAEPLEVNEKQLVIYTPSEYLKDVIERRLAEPIHDALFSLYNQDMNLVVYSEQDMAIINQKNNPPAIFDCNPQFTFDTFVVGSSNSFAHAAAYSVSQHPADVNNPLFIYGPSGLGKTHLLYAIANELRVSHPDFNMVYIKGDQFTNELITALQAGKNNEFRNKYRKADLFLVDDIQFIAGKESTQEEFFHTFNALYENHKQIVLTSDRPPHEMHLLQDRLQTRFEWGLICDIHPPDYETRMAITLTKASSLGLKLPDDVASYIAQNITNNIRQIEGTVKRIAAYHDLQHMPLDLPNVSRAIKDMFKGKTEALPTPELIISEVCRFYSIEERVLRGTLKNKATSEARHCAMYLIRTLTNLSYPDIAKEFNKDHTSVLHAIKKVDKALQMPGNPFEGTLKEIQANINAKL